MSSENWRERLKFAVKRDGRKQAAIAWAAGITPETLSRIMTGRSARPQLETVARIAHACGTTVGWLLSETELLTSDERGTLRDGARILSKVLRLDDPRL
jgi:transcriptional regulator with XRE-family HTH domain